MEVESWKLEAEGTGRERVGEEGRERTGRRENRSDREACWAIVSLTAAIASSQFEPSNNHMLIKLLANSFVCTTAFLLVIQI